MGYDWVMHSSLSIEFHDLRYFFFSPAALRASAGAGRFSVSLWEGTNGGGELGDAAEGARLGVSCGTSGGGPFFRGGRLEGSPGKFGNC